MGAHRMLRACLSPSVAHEPLTSRVLTTISIWPIVCGTRGTSNFKFHGRCMFCKLVCFVSGYCIYLGEEFVVWTHLVNETHLHITFGAAWLGEFDNSNSFSRTMVCKTAVCIGKKKKSCGTCLLIRTNTAAPDGHQRCTAVVDWCLHR